MQITAEKVLNFNVDDLHFLSFRTQKKNSTLGISNDVLVRLIINITYVPDPLLLDLTNSIGALQDISDDLLFVDSNICLSASLPCGST